MNLGAMGAGVTPGFIEGQAGWQANELQRQKMMQMMREQQARQLAGGMLTQQQPMPGGVPMPNGAPPQPQMQPGQSSVPPGAQGQPGGQPQGAPMTAMGPGGGNMAPPQPGGGQGAPAQPAQGGVQMPAIPGQMTVDQLAQRIMRSNPKVDWSKPDNKEALLGAVEHAQQLLAPEERARSVLLIAEMRQSTEIAKITGAFDRALMQAQSREAIADLKADFSKQIAVILAGSRERVADTNAGSRERVAGTNADARRDTAATGAASRERVADTNQAGATERANIGAGSRERVADTNATARGATDASRERVADVTADSRRDVADIGAAARGATDASRERVAQTNTQSRERIASAANEVKSELGQGKLSNDRKKIEGTQWYQRQMVELKSRGLADAAVKAQMDHDVKLIIEEGRTSRAAATESGRDTRSERANATRQRGQDVQARGQDIRSAQAGAALEERGREADQRAATVQRGQDVGQETTRDRIVAQGQRAGEAQAGQDRRADQRIATTERGQDLASADRGAARTGVAGRADERSQRQTVDTERKGYAGQIKDINAKISEILHGRTMEGIGSAERKQVQELQRQRDAIREKDTALTKRLTSAGVKSEPLSKVLSTVEKERKDAKPVVGTKEKPLVPTSQQEIDEAPSGTYIAVYDPATKKQSLFVKP